MKKTNRKVLSDGDIEVKRLMPMMQAAARLIVKLRTSAPRRRGRMGTIAPPFKLPGEVELHLRKVGLGKELQRMKKAMRGDDPVTRKVERILPSTRALGKVFQSIRPKLDGELWGRVVANVWTSTLDAVTLAEDLRALVRIDGRYKRRDLRLELGKIYEVELGSQHRATEQLRKDIPQLIRELGGDPSEELTGIARTGRKGLPRKAKPKGRR